MPETLFLAGLEDPLHAMAVGSLLAAFAVKYRRVNAEARTAEGQVPALPGPKRLAQEFVYTAPKKQSAPVAACATCD